MKIISWNIAAGRKMSSSDQFSYTDEELGYFVDCLHEINPDIACLQETHSSDNSSQAKKIADKLGFEYVADCPCDISHIDSNYKLTNSLMSRYKFDAESFELPYNWFGIYVNRNNEEEPALKKYVQVAKFKDFTVANIHTSPLHIFGDSYDEGNGKKLAQQIDEFLLEKLSAPLVFCGDFNYQNTQKLIPMVYERYGLQEALPNGETRPGKGNLDHILCSKEFDVVDSGIVETQSDHYLCWAELRMK